MLCCHIEASTKAGNVSFLVRNLTAHEEPHTMVFPQLSWSSFRLASRFLTISSSTIDSISNCITCTGLS